MSANVAYWIAVVCAAFVAGLVLAIIVDMLND